MADEQREHRRPRALYGRERELARVCALLAAGARLVTLRGPPGVGKTTLARAAAKRVRGRRAVVIVSLAHVDTRASTLAALARGLGLMPRTADESLLVDRIVRQLEEKATILLVDGVDGVRPEVRSIVDDLLAETADLSVLACSRAPLGSALEVVVSLAPLSEEDATDLLVDRARQIAPQRGIDRVCVAQLARRCGGLPLAIEIVSAWVAALGARETLSALSNGRLALDALDQALDASWTLLRPDERRSFVALGVFRGRFDLDAACAALGSARAASHVASLVTASLLEAHDTDDGARYAMLDGVRSYAARLADEQRITEGALTCLAEHFAESPRPRADLPSSWRRLADERADLLVAWEHALPRAPDIALRLAVVLEPSLAAQGPPALHRSILERSIAASEAARLPERALTHACATIDLLFALGRLAALRGHYAASREPLERGISLAERSADDLRSAWLRAHLALSECALGRVEAAAELAARARSIGDRHPDDRLRATVEHAVAGLHFVAGRLEAAGEAYRRASTSARAASALRLEGVALLGWGRIHLERGDVDAAERTFAEARACFESATDAVHLARLTAHEGAVALARERVDDAEERFSRALDEVSLQDDIEGELEARLGLVRVARARGAPRLAERRLDDFDLALRRTDDPSWEKRRAELGRATDGCVAGPPVILRLTRDGRALELGPRALDFGRRGPLRRILVALAERREASPGRAMSVVEIQKAGWPGEKMLHASAVARVYMAVRRLRVLGLDAAIRTSDEGYALDESVSVVWSDGA